MPPFSTPSTAYLRQRPAPSGPAVRRGPGPTAGTRPVQVGVNGFEERQVGDRWVIRGRVPGIVPSRDVTIELGRHTLLLDSRVAHVRQVFSVPTGIAAEDVKVTYVGDLLTISLPLSGSVARAR